MAKKKAEKAAETIVDPGPDTPKKEKKKRLTQEHLPGTAPEKNPRVHNAAKKYQDCMDASREAKRQENSAKDKLIDVMKDEGVKVYIYGDVNVEAGSKDTVKVRIKSAPADDEDDDGDE